MTYSPELGYTRQGFWDERSISHTNGWVALVRLASLMASPGYIEELNTKIQPGMKVQQS